MFPPHIIDFLRALSREQEAMFAARMAAADRSNALLKQWLSPEQLEQFEREKCFVVVGCHTGDEYVIKYGMTWNVQHGAEMLCFLPDGLLPISDMLLAQKIALETDEEAVLAVANHEFGGAGGCG